MVIISVVKLCIQSSKFIGRQVSCRYRLLRLPALSFWKSGRSWILAWVSFRTVRFASISQLLLNQLVVVPSFLKEVVVIASFLNLPVLHHEYSICVYNCGKSVSYNYDSGLILATVLSQVFNRLLDHAFAVGIQGWCCLIKYYYFWLSEESPSDWYSLLLTSAQLTSLFANLWLVLVGKPSLVAQKLKTPSPFSNLIKFIFAHFIFKSVSNIFPDCSWKQSCFLINQSYLFPEEPSIHLRLIFAPKKYLPCLNLIKLLNKFDDGWLSRSTFTNKGHILSVINLERKISKSNSFRDRVLESNIIKLDISWYGFLCALKFIHQRFVSQHLKNLLHCVCSIDNICVTVCNSSWWTW